jgi:hypothetical protein
MILATFGGEKTKPICGGGWEIGPGWAVLVRFGQLAEEDALAGIVRWVEGELVIVIFGGINRVFGEAEAVGPPGFAVRGDRADEKVAGPTFNDVVAERYVEVVYRYLDDKLPLLGGILHRPGPGFVNAFAAHLHRHDSSAARPEVRPADADYGGGDFAVRLEGEFPAAFFCFPRADEKGRELPAAVNGDLDAVFDSGCAPAAGRDSSKEKTSNQEYKSFHRVNFRRL